MKYSLNKQWLPSCALSLCRALTLAITLVAGSAYAEEQEFNFETGGAFQQEDDFLPVDEAFVLSANLDDGRVLLRWDMADGYYLYRHQFAFSAKDAVGFSLSEAQIPQGKQKFDDYFGDVEVYYHSAEAEIPIVSAGASATTGQIVVAYQGCADAGLCYAPERKRFDYDGYTLVPVSSGEPKSSAFSSAEPASSAIENSGVVIPVTEEQALAGILADENLLYALALFFIAGIGLAFTPCVLPMVPILSSIIVGEGEGISQRRAFTLSLAYVLGMAITYALIGTLVGLFGATLNLQAALQSAPVLIFFAGVFVVLSFSMFGFYELQLPQAWQNRLNQMGSEQKGGKHVSVFIMGSLSSLVVSPCVSAPLAGALIYISTSNDAALGGTALLALGLGMGIPLLIVGASGGKWLPKAGAWMDNVKAVFGVGLLAVAIWLIERVVPAEMTLALWAALLLGSGVYLGVLDSSPRSGWGQFTKSLGAISFLCGILLLIGAALGAQDPLKPLAPLTAARVMTGEGVGNRLHEENEFIAVKSIADIEAITARSDKPVLLDLYADWCISCKVMERNVFPEPVVAKLLAKFTLLRADVTLNDDTDQALLNNYGLFGPPSFVFFGQDGSEITEVRLQGELEAEPFAAHLQVVLNVWEARKIGEIAGNF